MAEITKDTVKVGDKYKIKKLPTTKEKPIIQHLFSKGSIITIIAKTTTNCNASLAGKVDQYVSYEDLENVEKFSKGDKVVIKKDTRFYVDNDRHNPKNSEGVVHSADGTGTGDSSMPIQVEWEKGYSNAYHEDDLEKVDTIPVAAIIEAVVAKTKPTGKYKIKKGDTVKISRKSTYYTRLPSDDNPKDTLGVVTGTGGLATIEVKWDNGTVNYYTSEDLVVLKRAK